MTDTDKTLEAMRDLKAWCERYGAYISPNEKALPIFFNEGRTVIHLYYAQGGSLQYEERKSVCITTD
jgi:hypothetical protein